MIAPDALKIFDKTLSPVEECLTQKSARALLELRADPRAQKRIDELAEKANEGAITPDEKSEYEALIWAGNLVAVLQAKARHSLKARKAA